MKKCFSFSKTAPVPALWGRSAELRWASHGRCALLRSAPLAVPIEKQRKRTVLKCFESFIFSLEIFQLLTFVTFLPYHILHCKIKAGSNDLSISLLVGRDEMEIKRKWSRVWGGARIWFMFSDFPTSSCWEPSHENGCCEWLLWCQGGASHDKWWLAKTVTEANKQWGKTPSHTFPIGISFTLYTLSLSNSQQNQ